MYVYTHIHTHTSVGRKMIKMLTREAKAVPRDEGETLAVLVCRNNYTPMVSVCICMFVCMSLSLSLSLCFLYVCLCLYVYTHIYTCRLYVSWRTVWISQMWHEMRSLFHTHTLYLDIHTYTHAYVYVYIYIYIYTYIHSYTHADCTSIGVLYGFHKCGTKCACTTASRGDSR